MMHGCDRKRVKTLSRKFDKWECIWCGAKQTVKKGAEPDGACQRVIDEIDKAIAYNRATVAHYSEKEESK